MQILNRQLRAVWLDDATPKMAKWLEVELNCGLFKLNDVARKKLFIDRC